jgi:hypothetical protein
MFRALVEWFGVSRDTSSQKMAFLPRQTACHSWSDYRVTMTALKPNCLCQAKPGSYELKREIQRRSCPPGRKP